MTGKARGKEEKNYSKMLKAPCNFFMSYHCCCSRHNADLNAVVREVDAVGDHEQMVGELDEQIIRQIDVADRVFRLVSLSAGSERAMAVAREEEEDTHCAELESVGNMTGKGKRWRT